MFPTWRVCPRQWDARQLNSSAYPAIYVQKEPNVHDRLDLDGFDLQMSSPTASELHSSERMRQLKYKNTIETNQPEAEILPWPILSVALKELLHLDSHGGRSVVDFCSTRWWWGQIWLNQTET